MDELVIVDGEREIALCPEHGAWYAKGCARCAADLDAMAGQFDDARYALTARGRELLREAE